jgi:hypothetical protein
MFTHLLVLLCASASVVATPAPNPGVVVVTHNVGGCASGLPVCCAVVGHDHVRCLIRASKQCMMLKLT